TSQDGSYRIGFPAPPMTQRQAQTLPNGQTVNVTLHMAEKDNQVYFSAATDLPQGTGPAQHEEMFKNSEAGGAARMPGARFLSRKSIDLNGMPGREVEFALPKGPEMPGEGLLR